MAAQFSDVIETIFDAQIVPKLEDVITHKIPKEIAFYFDSVEIDIGTIKANDFDNDGTIEQIITQNYNGGDYPLHQKKELTSQILALKKKNIKASDYAKRTIDELFPKNVIDNTILKQSNISESVIAINDGNGNFTIKILR